jgi:alpha-galactosidase
MKKLFLPFLLFAFFTSHAQQKISFSTAKFKTGDNMQWKERSFNDASWKTIKPNITWEEQGYDYDGYAWYRFHFKLPSSLKAKSYWKDSLRIFLAKIDDVDETFLNGEKINQTGSFPSDDGGYEGKYDITREYHISAKDPLLRWDKENVIAVRVYDGGGGGGIFDATPFISMMDIIDGASLSIKADETRKDQYNITVSNALQIKLNGTLTVSLKDGAKNITTKPVNQPISVDALQAFTKNISVPSNKRIEITVSFREKHTGKTKSLSTITHYILTPAASLTPKINGAKIVGVRPNSPFIYKIAATGEKPLKYEVENLPRGLYMDENTGVISGTLSAAGDYKMKFIVSNGRGKDDRTFTIRVGDVIGLTPAMGWNSWNCWGTSVSDAKVRSSAQALIDKGLIDHGWNYINIDDGWEAEQRDTDGNIVPNEKFPDMHGLGDWLHAHGLKFGIYSSPGTRTCGGYLASYQHEMQDATSYANWGIDYLKYDWCSYGDVYKKEGDTSVTAFMKPYRVMQHALQAQNRDIYYSLCQYGMKDVWKWGPEVDGNSWRTTGDITDTWQSLYRIGFSQNKLYRYSMPGHWNDPDMLIVGQVGWGENLHPTRLTADEQYTHISLWCLLSAPLLIGCDISKMDDFTLNLLTNDEVLAIDQDVYGKQAQRKIKTPSYQVWMKLLEDGSYAMGIFNLSKIYQTVSVTWKDAGLAGSYKVRDVWRQKDLGFFPASFSTKIPPHGVTLIKLQRAR